jgi:hypothetical protein
MDYPPGWTCERTTLEFRTYLLGMLILEQALAVAEHLEACNGCAQKLVLQRLSMTAEPRG